VAANRRAAELDPLDLNLSSRLAQVLIIFDRIDEAIERIVRLVEMDPRYLVSHIELADAYVRIGEGARSVAAAERAMELSSGHAPAAVGLAIVANVQFGNRARARELVHDLAERAERGYVVPFWLAVGHAALGDLDRAFEHLVQARHDRDPNLLYITATPRAIGWHADPRYAELLRDIGLLDQRGDPSLSSAAG